MSQTEWIFGLHAVQAALSHEPESVFEVWVAKERRDHKLKQITQLCQSQKIPVHQKHKRDLDTRAQGRHQGVLALVQKPEDKQLVEAELPLLLEQARQPRLLLILDGVTDPHNLGACLRSADAAGVNAVIVPKDKSASLTPTARKVACGAAESTPLVQVTNLARCLRELQEAGFWLIGTAGEADDYLYDCDLTGDVAIVMGAEEKGLRRLTRETCDQLAKLPMAGKVSSLNVSVAAGVSLFEAVRQRREKPR